MDTHNLTTTNADWLDLINAIDIGVVITDSDFKVEVWNRFMQNHSRLRRSSIVGQDLFAHFPEIDKEWLKSKCKPVLSLQTPVFTIWEQRPFLFQFTAARPFTSTTEYMYQNVTIIPVGRGESGVSKLCFIIHDVTDQALSKIRIQGLNSKLQTISRVDGLTGLFNRRYWQERFDREYKLSCRNKSVHSILMLDIDHFKRINDTYGHQTGDAVIKHLARIITFATRETDISGRYGGEEFIILLTDTSAKNAMTVAQRIRKSVSGLSVKYAGNEIKYTCSLGVAEYDSSFSKSQMWIEAADNALYAAKKNGRNQVVTHGEY